MKADFFVPQANDGVFNKIRFLELDQEKATKLVEEYNEECKKFLKADVVDLTKDNERRVTPPVSRRKASRSPARSPPRRRRRSRSREKRRSRSPRPRVDDRRSSLPRNRRRPRSPTPNRNSRDRSAGRKSGWNQSPPPKRSDNGWAKEEPYKDPYGFDTGGPKNDDMSKYGFGGVPEPAGRPMDRGSMDRGKQFDRPDQFTRPDQRETVPSYLGSRRLPNGLIFKKKVNESALRALDGFELGHKQDFRRRETPPLPRKPEPRAPAPRGPELREDRNYLRQSDSRQSDYHPHDGDRNGSYGSNDRGFSQPAYDDRPKAAPPRSYPQDGPPPYGRYDQPPVQKPVREPEPVRDHPKR